VSGQLNVEAYCLALTKVYPLRADLPRRELEHQPLLDRGSPRSSAVAGARSGSRYWAAAWAERGIDRERHAWYRDLRRYGTMPHAGFGPGFERVLAYFTGLSNVRDAITFPRTPGNARY
jgi:aspartyl/asparaginyl-tRNA synthetase